jgi:hypothetical protein
MFNNAVKKVHKITSDLEGMIETLHNAEQEVQGLIEEDNRKIAKLEAERAEKEVAAKKATTLGNNLSKLFQE